jgi:hypothetical protein
MEIYKDVIGYEGDYQVSNIGNVKSLKFNKQKILNACKDLDGYYKVNLVINGLSKSRLVHQLVAESFLNHKRCGYKLVVNHIDFNRTNNNVENLEIITTRENVNRKHLKSSSKYTGVSWDKNRNKWISKIKVNGKTINLGRFENELDASIAYEEKLNNLTN